MRSLELLGKVTETAAFTERRETIKVDNSATARQRLLKSLRLALSGATDVASRPALELLEELKSAQRSDPPPGHPLTPEADPGGSLHSNPLKQFDRDSASITNHPSTPTGEATVTGVTDKEVSLFREVTGVTDRKVIKDS